MICSWKLFQLCLFYLLFRFNTVYHVNCFLFRFMCWKTGWNIMRKICMSHQLEQHIEVSTQFWSQISFLFVRRIQFGLENKMSVFLKHIMHLWHPCFLLSTIIELAYDFRWLNFFGETFCLMFSFLCHPIKRALYQSS